MKRRPKAALAPEPGSGAAIPAEPVLDALPHGLLVLDADLRVLRANPRYGEITGARAGETTGRRLFEISNGLWDVAPVRALVDAARTGEGGRADVELELGDGHRRAVRLHVRRLGTPPSGPERLLVVVDFALRAGTARADAGAGRARPDEIRRRDELVARAAHELRGPLGSISNWAHLLAQGSPDESLQQRALAAIRRALDVATRLIESLHDVSLLAAGRVSLRSDLVDLASVVDMALERPRSAALDKGVRLEFVREVPSVPVIGDPDRLQQIVLNLLANAVECTPPGGRVEISVGREGASWRLAVADTGRGIAPEVLPRIFGGLRPADFTGARPPATLGAGLTIVRHLAELHGGSVEASSAGRGLGARFVVRLPIPEPVRGHAPSRLAAAKEPAGGARPVGADPSGGKPTKPDA